MTPAASFSSLPAASKARASAPTLKATVRGSAVRAAAAAGRRPGSAYLAFQLSTQHQKLMEAEFKPLGLSIAVWRPLMFLKAAGLCTMTRLSRLSGIDRTTLTRMVDRLVADGLVRREPSASDRRLVVLSLSAKGEEIYRIGAPVEARVNSRMFQGMPAPEHVRLRQLLADALARTVSDAELLQDLLVPCRPPSEP